MSLILDALKKLERDKQTREPGVVVVGAVPWQGVRAPRTRLRLAGGLLAVAFVSLTVWWLAGTRTPPGRPTAPPRSPAAAPTPAPGAGAARAEAPSAAAQPPLAVPSAPARLVIPGEAESPTVMPAAGPGADLQLNAITERDGQPVALISGRLVREGDRIDGIHVLRIGATEVEIEVRGRRRTLRF